MNDIDLNWKLVKESLELLQAQTDRVDAAAKAAMITPESPLWEPAHIIGNNLLYALSWLVDDCFDSISWYVHECDL